MAPPTCAGCPRDTTELGHTLQLRWAASDGHPMAPLGVKARHWHFCQRCHGERWPLDRRCRNRWSRPGSAQPLRGGEVVARLPVGDFHLTTPIPEELREVVGPRASPPARSRELPQPAELPPARRLRAGPPRPSRAPALPAAPCRRQPGAPPTRQPRAVSWSGYPLQREFWACPWAPPVPSTLACDRAGCGSNVGSPVKWQARLPSVSRGCPQSLGFYSGSVITTARSLCFFNIPAISRPYPGRIFSISRLFH